MEKILGYHGIFVFLKQLPLNFKNGVYSAHFWAVATYIKTCALESVLDMHCVKQFIKIMILSLYL